RAAGLDRLVERRQFRPTSADWLVRDSLGGFVGFLEVRQHPTDGAPRIAPAQVELIERLERALPGFCPRAHALLRSRGAQRVDLLQAGERGLAALVRPPRVGALLRLLARVTGEHPEGDRDRVR